MFVLPYFYCFLRPWLKFYYQRLSSHSNFLNINDIKRKKILRFRAYKVSEYYNILRTAGFDEPNHYIGPKI